MAAFNNIETQFPNFFMTNGLSTDDVRGHAVTCFCVRCRAKNVTVINDRYIPLVDNRRKVHELRSMMLEVLPGELQRANDTVFEVTRRMIIHGKVYRDACLEGTDYELFKPWAKKQPFYQEFVHGTKVQQREFARHCQLVNDCAYVYDKWDGIVSNLQDKRMTFIQARNFTVAKFRAATVMNWCIIENEHARTGSAPRREGETLWTSDDVNNFAQQALAVGRIAEADRHQAARFCQAVERQVLVLVKARMRQDHAHEDDQLG